MSHAVIDLHDVAKVNRIPLGTLRRWASEGNWQPVGMRRGHKVYDRDTVADAIAARFERQQAA